MVERYKLPLRVSATREYTKIIDLQHTERITEHIIGKSIKVFKDYTAWGDQLEIVDANDCTISLKRFPQICNAYTKLLRMYENGELERIG